jgi:putative ABC transport system permease protein
MDSYVELTVWQVALAGLLILVNAALSVALRLGLEKTLAIASLRTVLQLALLGWILGFVFRMDRWYRPQYAIPILGMVLGNSLNGISVGLSTLTESLVRHRDRVETAITLGATRFEAAAEPIRESVRTGMIPIINAMMIVGIVSLPGMMTGQLVSGMDPGQAVRYQIVIMFLIASATALGTVIAVQLSVLRLFTRDHRFRSEWLETDPKS